ncbi:MAG: ASCH domain-containing protein [Kiritimatiellota bacterium]|nr:ASCH domain-containing protein [Kiritimatiellota bacterium]
MKIKALSFRQPWAMLILEGRKTLDLRTWTTHYRGPLAIYASLEVEKEACLKHGLNPQTLSTGVVIGIVDLVDIIPLNEAAYGERQSEHLAGRSFRPGLFGWVLKNPRPVEPPVVVKGRLNLFDVDIQTADDRPLTITHQTTPTIASPIVHRPPSTVASSEFELRVLPETGNGYRLEFTQKLVEAVPDQPYLYQQPAIKTRVCVEVGGDSLRAVADMVLDALRQNGYKPTDLSASRREPFHLDELTGVRLGLIFLAVKPISKANRVEAISQGVRAMTAEELYYWYSKCTGGPTAERAQKALRVLLSEE